ncbi:unnamed protein product [Parascedosporium putredinis]|uniref:Enoyl reductase (ER) domain-containing protein n=1 Tax=Parascedosporium putredinis TaxID=1442378 RepID=A0A9P1H6M1_9PEZI|nr:unnamed protein product [Parascedosporium putredinis]CAI8000540.1 unnamed protein product [Parascedosporium putredinis]
MRSSAGLVTYQCPLHLLRALYGYGPYQTVVGHEGVGTVVKLGPGVQDDFLHQRVGVKWVYSACGECAICRKGFENNCPNQINTGRHVAGTLQQYVVADARYVTPIPADLPSETAAPLLCAGLTMAGAVSKLRDLEADRAPPRQTPSYRRGFGEAKRKLSLESGADHFVDYREENVEERVKAITEGEGAAAALVVPASEEAFAVAPRVVRNMGAILTIGLPRNDYEIPLSASLCSARSLTVAGVATAVEVANFEDIPDIFEKLKTGSIVGRIVVKIPQ